MLLQVCDARKPDAGARLCSGYPSRRPRRPEARGFPRLSRPPRPRTESARTGDATAQPTSCPRASRERKTRAGAVKTRIPRATRRGPHPTRAIPPKAPRALDGIEPCSQGSGGAPSKRGDGKREGERAGRGASEAATSCQIGHRWSSRCCPRPGWRGPGPPRQARCPRGRRAARGASPSGN